MNLFLDRLRGDRIGFSVLGIFVIEKNTILTVRKTAHNHQSRACLRTFDALIRRFNIFISVNCHRRKLL